MKKEELDKLEKRIDGVNKILNEMSFIELLLLQKIVNTMVDQCFIDQNKQDNEKGSSKKQE